MSIKRILAISLRFAFLLKHNKTRFMNIFVWAALDILVWGFITIYLDKAGKADFSFVTLFLSAAILWLFLIRVQQGFVLPMFEDIWSRNFMNLFASPLSLGEYVLGLILSSVFITIFGFGAILLIAYFVFGYSLFYLGLSLIPFLIILFIFGLVLAMFSFTLVLRYGAPAEWFAWIMPFLLSPLSSIYYPVSILPSFIQPFTKIIPTPYVFEGMRNVLLKGEFLWMNILVGFIVSLIYLIGAYWLLTFMYRKVLKSGLLTRASAENF